MNEEKQEIANKIIRYLRKENWEIDKKGYSYFDIEKAIDMAYNEALEEVEKMIDEFQIEKMLWSSQINDWYVHAEDWEIFKQSLKELKEKK